MQKQLPDAFIDLFKEMWNEIDRIEDDLVEVKDQLSLSISMENVRSFHRASNIFLEKINQLRKKLKIFYRATLILLEEKRQDIHRYYILIERGCKYFDNKSKIFLSIKIINSEIEEEVYTIERKLEKFQVHCDRFIGYISNHWSLVQEKFISLAAKPKFLKNIPSEGDFLKFLLSFAYNADKELKIMSQTLDEIHALFLRKIVQSTSLNIKVVLRWPKRNGKNVLNILSELMQSTNLLVKVNYEAHGRVYIADDQFAMVTTTDLVYATYIAHFEAGFYTPEEKNVKDIVNFFDAIWRNSPILGEHERPLVNETKAVVEFEDRRHHYRPLDVIEEVKLAIHYKDKWVRFRTAQEEGWGYIDSKLHPDEVVKNLMDAGTVVIKNVVPAEIIREVKDVDEIISTVNEFVKKRFPKGKYNIIVKKLSTKYPFRKRIDEIKSSILKSFAPSLGNNFSESASNVFYLFIFEKTIILGSKQL